MLDAIAKYSEFWGVIRLSKRQLIWQKTEKGKKRNRIGLFSTSAAVNLTVPFYRRHFSVDVDSGS